MGISLLAQLVERLDTQTEGPRFESLQWRLICLLYIYIYIYMCVCVCVCVEASVYVYMYICMICVCLYSVCLCMSVICAYVMIHNVISNAVIVY